MAARLGCVGPFGRVSPSLVGAERDERETKYRPQSSFKHALDDALDELDTQAENGQLSSGAYMQVAKKMKIIYDSQNGSRDLVIRQIVVQMALEHVHILHVAPKEVDWLTDDFLEELLWAASEKHQQILTQSDNIYSMVVVDEWIKHMISAYIADEGDYDLFWDGFHMVTKAMAQIPLPMGGRIAKCLGEFLIDVAIHNTNLYEIEPFGYDDASQDALMQFWKQKFTRFPSEHLFEFMSRLFDDAEDDYEESEIEFRKKLKKKIRRGLKRRCTCVTCSQLFPKLDVTKPESHASTMAL